MLGGYTPCDIMVTFGIPKQKTVRGQKIGELWQKHKGQHIVLERGYIKRDDYFMVGWDGLNGRARFNNNNSPRDRLDALSIQLEPWNNDGSYILICGQVHGDASIQHANYQKWLGDIATEIHNHHKNPEIVFRPHPLDTDDWKLPHHVKVCKAKSLEESIGGATVVIAFNSNASIDAMIAGKQTIAYDEGSMLYKSSFESYEEFVREGPCNGYRACLYDIAYSQWNLDEMTLGLPHKHLGIK
jgi:hypothetical protein